ncbi:MAG TPA: DarT ssDNA thymidine ADP-ribosyltransferase family protein, partial [Pseudonocardiaceae bacterium]
GATMWSDTADDPTRATRRAAEFLAHRQVPWALIGQVVARTTATGRAVREILNDACSSQQVIVRRGWYYNGEVPSTRTREVYPPAGAPPAADMPIATPCPAMTVGRAALLAVLASYARNAMAQRLELIRPGASLLEIQKLMYLLQEAGLSLRLNYTKGRYGPYAENLNKVLQAMEGHYLRGYGDRSSAVLALEPIELLPDAEGQARSLLDGHPRVLAAVDRVLSLTAGWEGAYGMELLATVLFAARTDSLVATDPTRAADYVHTWNARKQATFPQAHVTKAWQRLHDREWFRTTASEAGTLGVGRL